MLIDELNEQLKLIEPNISLIKEYWTNAAISKQLADLDQMSQAPDFWQKTQEAKLLQKLRDQQDTYNSMLNNYQDLTELIDMFANDEPELRKLQPEIFALSKLVRDFKINLLLNEPDDSSNCFLNINAGAGGTESQDWANILLRMYLRFCEDNKLTSQILDLQNGEEAGIKSATLYIKGKNPFGILKTEAGVHRLVRISPFDSNKRRHTSFASVQVTPEAPDIEINIDPKDLRIDTYRAGGAGGQHVNKTDSAVRITHLPTNIVVQCQNERSQTQNKETAMKMLMAKMLQKQKDELESKKAGVEKKKIEWGSQIRSYVLHPYKMVKDHRTDHESPQPDLVLDGELMPFIERSLIWLHQN
jgi:peptide chain release factor 2